MSTFDFTWEAGFIGKARKEDDSSLPIAGELLNAGVNKNGWAVDEKELPNIAKQCKRGVRLSLDHSRSVRDIVGGTTNGEYDPKTKKVMFEAEVDDLGIISKIQKGRVKYVSIGAEADAFCSKCSQPIVFMKTCKCKSGHILIKNTRLKEVSIISEPAYKNSKFKPKSFVASVEEALAQKIEENKKEEINMVTENTTETFNAEKLEAGIRKTLTKEMEKMANDMFNPIKTEVEKVSKAVETLEKSRQEAVKLEELKKEEESKKKEKEESEKSLKELIQTIVKEEVEKATKAQEEEEEEEEEEDKEKTKKEKTEAIEGGAKVENEEGKVEITGDIRNDVWKEIEAAAKKYHIL